MSTGQQRREKERTELGKNITNERKAEEVIKSGV